MGYGISERFVAEGAAVYIADASPEVETVAALLSERYSAQVSGYVGDLSRPEVADRLVAEAVAGLGTVDILVNNAGGGVISTTAGHTEDTLRRTIDNNLWTTIRCTMAVIPHMAERGYGRVVNVGAESVRNGLDGHAIYNAAKGGVHAVCTGWAREFAHRGITFNTVAPSYVSTPELREAEAEGRLSAEFLQMLARAVELIPMGRPAEVAEVASAVLYLASEESGFVTGQTLSVNGGSSMG